MTSDFDLGPADDEAPDPSDLVSWCKALAREGSNALASRAAVVKPPTLTDAESAALARKRLEAEEKR